MSKWKSTFSKVFLVLWCVSLLVHLLAVFDVQVHSFLPFIWILHILTIVAFAVGLISVLDSGQLTINKRQSSRDPFQMYRIIFKGKPKWLILITAASFIYAVVNFMLFTRNTQGGGPGIIDGEMVLHNHGEIIRYLSEEEYNYFKVNEIRGFSGHWMAFQSAAVSFLWPVKEA